MCRSYSELYYDTDLYATSEWIQHSKKRYTVEPFIESAGSTKLKMFLSVDAGAEPLLRNPFKVCEMKESSVSKILNHICFALNLKGSFSNLNDFVFLCRTFFFILTILKRFRGSAGLEKA